MSFLTVKDIYKSFDQNQVLRGVDFELNKGEVLGVLGSSGGGKTTLLRCLTFLEQAEQGQIFINGKKIFDAAVDEKQMKDQIKEARKSFGLVFQQFNLFPQYTVLENVTLAPKLEGKLSAEEIDKKAKSIIERVGLTNRIDVYPHQLSGGQQQRVAIARALIMEPDILCFDEPTSALDPELTGEVLRVIRSLKSSDHTMIIVTHEINFAREVADKIIFMDKGVIVEQGTPEQVIDNPKAERTKEFLRALEA